MDLAHPRVIYGPHFVVACNVNGEEVFGEVGM